MKYFLGMEVYQSKDEIFICQTKYAQDMLNKFDMLFIVIHPLLQVLMDRCYVEMMVQSCWI